LPEAIAMTALPPLPAPILKALADKGFETLTAVQEAVLADGYVGRDLLVSAQTGSGKTLAFGLALAADLIEADGTMSPPATPRALIIAPTRELALQVGRELEWLYAPAGAVIAHCVGGMDSRAERRTLDRGAHLVVGTPGRLRDHLERGSLDPSTLGALVLDEADEMLDLGFREDLEFMLAALPTPRRTLMFSATLSPEIERLAQTYMADPARIATESRRSAHADIAYQALVVEPSDQETAIVNVLRYHEAKNALVFCKTRAMVNHLTARFHNRGFAVVPLSGELAQEERARALQSLRDGRARVCVATDVAARGIDLPGLDLVIHADLPGSTETLLHRSGRTGRAGRKGVSVLIVPISAKKKVQRMLAQASLSAEWGSAPSASDVTARDTERLLTDPALTAPETADEGLLITQLAERFTARELAAGVARQYFAARSAPEDVAQVAGAANPDAPAPRRERTEFSGPWLRLSAGAQDGAEARWLLPMLCRAGNITRTEIGAIRVQDDHTLVQLSTEGGAQFMAAVGETMMLDQGIAIEEIDAPDLGATRTVRAAPRRDTERPVRSFDADRPARAPRPAGDGPARPPRAYDADRPARAPRADSDKPYGARPQGDKPYGARPQGDKPYGARSQGDKPYGARPQGDRPYGDKPRPGGFKPGGAKPGGYKSDRPASDRPYGDRPKFDRPHSDRPQSDRPQSDRPNSDRPYSGGPKPEGRAERPFRARSDDAPRPPRAAEAPATPARPRVDPDAARNPSARLAPAKGAKPAFKGGPGAKAGPRTGAKPFGKPGAKPLGKPRPTGDGPPRRPGGPGRPRS
jgi:ATP-dependent RNA helicase DeaD